MKIINNLFIIFFLFLLTLSNSYSDDKIKFIDLDSLLEKTTIGKKIIEDLNIANNNNLKLLKPKEDIIKKKKKKKKTKKNNITKNK